jgi:threonine/homoserine/homoserine lactone efflux protein
MLTLLRGVIIGLSIAAPVGPIGVLCIHRTIFEGRRCGFVSGLGAATADAVYGALATFGLGALANPLLRYQFWLRLLAGLLLCALGISIFLREPASAAAQPRAKGLLAAYASTFVLTLANPATILSFAAIFIGLGLGGVGGDALAGALLVLGVFVGSCLWWLILSLGVNFLAGRAAPGALRWVNRIAGAVLLGFGIYAFASLAL